jgi:HlyD family secretion protein
LRVKEIRFQEGDLVKRGDICVLMDTNTLAAQLEEAKLNVVVNQEKEAVERATIIKSKAQIALAKVEVARSKSLVAQRAGSQRELDVRRR